MPTLTQASIFSRKVVKWLTFGITTMVAGIILLAFGTSIRDSIFAPQPAPPTVAFGKLPKLDLSIGFSPPASATYSLETVTGSLPQIPQVAKVYAVEPVKFSFGDLQRAKSKAQNIGFLNEPQEVSTGVVKFVDPRDSQRVFTVETSTGNFTLESNYINDQNIITSKIPTLEQAQTRARDFLVSLGVNSDEFPDTNLEVKKLRIDGGNLVETLVLSQSNLAEVIFKRADLDKIPVINPKDEDPPIYVLLSSRNIAEAVDQTAKVQRFKFATYPLKGVQKAFQELKALKAAFNKEVSTNQLVIRDVSLGYLESKMDGGYLQPVYIFKGSDFTAYVPAVEDSWIIQPPSTDSSGS